MRTIRLPKLSRNAPVSALLFIALLVSALSSISEQQRIIQVGAVICLAAAATLALLMRRIQPVKLSFFELLLLFCALTSAFISSLLGYDTVSQYSFLFFLCMISIAAIVRTLVLRDLFDIFVLVAFAMLMIPLFGYMPQLIAALSLRISDIGLERFMPLDMHPNLVGFTYAGMFMIMACRFMLASSWSGRIFFLALTGLSLVYIIASSSRSAMLGVLVAGAIYVWAFATARDGNRKRRFQILFILGFLALAVLLLGPMRGYLLSAFEVQSDARGVNSGATGRVELWGAGIDLLLSSPFRLLFGYGFRSAEFNIIGFPVESSYIVLCLEIGVLSAALLVGLFLLSALKMVLIGRLGIYADEGRIFQFFGLAIVAFMVHSAFNRYLVGIGNPASLMALMMMSAFGVRQRFLAKRLATPQFIASTLPQMGNLS